jgi:hypothetical protein
MMDGENGHTNGHAGFPQEPGINRESVGYGKPPAEHQFKPGNRANPGGRPKGDSLTSIVREVLAEQIDSAADRKRLRKVAEAIVTAAESGNPKVIQQLWDRVDGKVPDRIAGHDGGPIRHQMEHDVRLSGLSDHELDTLGAIARRMADG